METSLDTASTKQVTVQPLQKKAIPKPESEMNHETKHDQAKVERNDNYSLQLFILFRGRSFNVARGHQL